MLRSRDYDISLQRILETGEHIEWAGQPKQGLVLRKSDRIMIPFSLLWGGFAIFWESMVILSDAPVFFWLWGIPFVIIGIYLIIGRLFVDARKRKHTWYLLTNRRVLMRQGKVKHTMRSIFLDALPGLSLVEKADGTGNILFSAQFNDFSPINAANLKASAKNAMMFEMIPEARYVHSMIKRLSKEAEDAQGEVE